MIETTHVLNRSVIFTEIPASPRLPEGTRLVVRKETAKHLEAFVVAITPAGVRYEFKSIHVGQLIKTPWVSPIDTEGAVIVPTPVAVVEAPKEPVNPFTIGDVASLEEGLKEDQLPAMDVTGSSSNETFEVPTVPESVKEAAAPPEFEIIPGEGIEGLESAPGDEDFTTAKPKGRKKAN